MTEIWIEVCNGQVENVYANTQEIKVTVLDPAVPRNMSPDEEKTVKEELQELMMNPEVYLVW